MYPPLLDMSSSSSLSDHARDPLTSDERVLSSVMGREFHENRIGELEKKIRDGTGDIIQLKRARNSLLNIYTRVPPEILGQIFCWRIVQDLLKFGRFQKNSYNFLLVCHHWFQVASSTPELWSYWGYTLNEWLQRSKRAGTAPVDLVLDVRHTTRRKNALDESLRATLRERAKRDAIRSIQLLREVPLILTSVLTALTPDRGDYRSTSIEFIVLRDVDASNFFLRCRFPKLWYLHLSTGPLFSSWERLASHTTALTTLILKIKTISSYDPTTTQILSILTSNPRLQNLTLSIPIGYPDRGDGSKIMVPLPRLKKLSINGDILPVIRLLQRLDYPEKMDSMTLGASSCTVEEILGILGPFVRNHIQRDGRSRDGLGLFIGYSPGSLSTWVSTVKNGERPNQKDAFASFTADFREGFLRHDNLQLCAGFLAHIPVEHVVYFGADLSTELVNGLVPLMPKIQGLHLVNPNLDYGFLRLNRRGPPSQQKILPSLQRLSLEDLITDTDEGWRPLLPYLIHQTFGDQRISLTITGRREHICKDVVKDMEQLVDRLDLDLILDDDCPFDICVVSEEEDE